MNINEIIIKKRNKEILNRDEIEYFVNGYTSGNIPDYQMSSLLMAIFLNGMTDEETFDLTDAMINSGDVFSYEDIDGVVVDKHSTGGIGDKTTPIIVPIVASLGCKVAKMSGRGLGFTGGTADKMESIKGYQVKLEESKFRDSLKTIGAAMIYQTGNIAPADKKIYALRDVTGTVESIPLIASSIMSKKIASGAKVIVLDVKVGNGAFMKDIESATKLAELMIKIGNHFNRKVVALLTNMNTPLGKYVGNKLELQEVCKVLNNEEDNALKELCVELASTMSSLALEKEYDECKNLVIESIKNGSALTKFKEIIANQGGDYNSINDLHVAKIIDIKSSLSGYISNINAEEIGESAMLLGAGRENLEDEIDYEVGIELKKTIGDYVSKGDSVAYLYVNDETNLDVVINKIQDAFSLTDKIVDIEPLIYKVIR